MCIYFCFLHAGMVTIESPEGAVCYLSSPELKCLFEEATGSAGWNMSKKHERFELNNGSVVKLNHNCSTPEYKSCVAVTLKNLTGIWTGKYNVPHLLLLKVEQKLTKNGKIAYHEEEIEVLFIFLS